VRFSDSIILEWYAISTETIRPGDEIQVQLIWSTDAPLAIHYKVFVQLLDANQVLVAQHDTEPGGGLYPTTSWIPGATIIDNHALMIPPDLRPAEYELIVGLYPADDPSPLARLMTNAAEGQQSYLTLARIVVVVE